MKTFKFFGRGGAWEVRKKFATLSGAATHAQKLADERGEPVWCHWNGRVHRAEPGGRVI